MKALIIKVLIIIPTLLNFSIWSFAQGVAINADGSPPHSSSGLDIDFSDKGILVPRLTTSERDAIISPIEGLQIFNTTDRCLQIRNGTSSQWENIYCFSGCSSAPVSNSTEAATNTTKTDFDANWTISSGATNYYIDVDDNSDFSSPLSGFNNLSVGNVLTYNISGLTCGTTYYYRVRANNDCGTSTNSNTTSLSTSSCFPPNNTCSPNWFTDSRDGKSYGAVTIPGSSAPYCLGTQQVWMCENLNVGTQVAPSVIQTSGPDNTNTSIEKYCHGGVNGTATQGDCSTLGGLYMWDEMMAYGSNVDDNGPGPQGICPTGWHIPTHNEYKCLYMNLGMSQGQADLVNTLQGTNEGTKLKTGGSSGFEAILGGSAVNAPPARFQALGNSGYYWNSSKITPADSPVLQIFADPETRIGTIRFNTGNLGLSVRCVQD